MNKTRDRVSDKHGMTMGEMLIVIAIIGVLAAVAFIAVWNHQRTLAQKECDEIAKEIFVAAQNHLTPLYGQGYLEKDLGIPETVTKGVDDTATGTGVYYLAVHKGDLLSDANSVIGDILPFGSIDETVRGGGNYIIRYQKTTGLVLDVFYCYDEDKKYGCNLKSIAINGDAINETNLKTMLEEYRGAGEARENRRHFELGEDDPVLGWYGAGAENLETIKLKEPGIVVTNAERLYVTIFDSNYNDNTVAEKYSVKLIITGVSSKAQKGILVKRSNNSMELVDLNGRVDTTKKNEGRYEVILDDITKGGNGTSRHFYHLGSDNGKSFIPGEDVRIRAVVYSNECLANIAYSSEDTENSLFAEIMASENNRNPNGAPDTAKVGNFRHLENLDIKISGLGSNLTNASALNIQSAVQTTDLDWENDTVSGASAQTHANQVDLMMHPAGVPDINTDDNDPGNGTALGMDNASGDVNAEQEVNDARKFWKECIVTSLVGTSTKQGCYMPISPNIDAFSYDGAKLSIKNVKVEEIDHAGLFGKPMSTSEIKDLRLIDFSISGTRSAGALAGSLKGTTVTNVIAYHTTRKQSTAIEKTVSAPTAGGLIGSVDDGAVRYSGAAVIVSATGAGAAGGGLIGSATGSTAITGCYAAGHTENGSYEEWISDTDVSGGNYDVTASGGTSGGLVGFFSGTGGIVNSYSTCSVSGGLAGGLVGEASGSITNCYATGLMDMAEVEDPEDRRTNSSIGAFAGSATGTISDCKYFSIINEVKLKKNGEEKGLAHYLGAIGDSDDTKGDPTGITKIDKNTSTYNTFVGEPEDWTKAEPYDSKLKDYYDNGTDNAKYNLKTVKELKGTDKPFTDGDYTWADIFVSIHHGDWPAPEIFIINED